MWRIELKPSYFAPTVWSHLVFASETLANDEEGQVALRSAKSQAGVKGSMASTGSVSLERQKSLNTLTSNSTTAAAHT